MRLFVAIDLPSDILEALARLVNRLRPLARISWTRPETWHLTTKFIGEWPDGRLAEMEAALRGLAAPPPIPIEVRGLGFFPNARAPRVFWAGIEAPAALGQLARDTEQALAALGIERERRPYSPHLTLARVKEPVRLDGLHDAVAKLPSTEFGAFTAGRFCLYRSTLQPGGAVYIRLAEFPFANP
jgi:2'-5' RNA ligase